jgi:phosphoribosyl-dephospho-CoA transferase
MAPHDLMKLAGAGDEWLPHDAPDWVNAALRRAPWVVVRRAACAPGYASVGVRGARRHERYAASIRMSQVADIVSPEQLLTRQSTSERTALPAMKLLATLQPWFLEHGLVGGPTGSTGFELASGLAVVSLASDLDLLLRPSRPFTRTAAQRLCGSLQALAEQAGCRIDVQVEGGHGAFALADYAGHERVLLRTAQGACLVVDPWLPVA